MKITIATSGRAHLLDCARELQKCGHDVTFYTYSPKSTLKRFGLIYGGKSLLYYVAPFEFLRRKLKTAFLYKLSIYVLDLLVCMLMKECDVFICQSPYYTRCMKKAKSKFGAIVILDRGTSHVKYFNRILSKIGIKEQSSKYINMDETQYSLADYITIASDFVSHSFEEYGVSDNKLFINPYGVSLENFYPMKCTNEFDFICVGQWSLRKGSNLVVEAFKNTNVRVLHVGSIIDVDFPIADNFVHIDSVPELELVKYYMRSRFFLFPSFEDGFGLVLCQALACGLPIVCSKHTGGPTLLKLLNLGGEIYLMDSVTSIDIKKGLTIMTKRYGCNGERIKINRRELEEKLSWNAYGKRYNDFLKNLNVCDNDYQDDYCEY